MERPAQSPSRGRGAELQEEVYMSFGLKPLSWEILTDRDILTNRKQQVLDALTVLILLKAHIQNHCQIQ